MARSSGRAFILGQGTVWEVFGSSLSVWRDLVPAVLFCVARVGCGGGVTVSIARVSPGSAYRYCLGSVAVGDGGRGRCRVPLPVGRELVGVPAGGWSGWGGGCWGCRGW